jgi:hypothetical protein
MEMAWLKKWIRKYKRTHKVPWLMGRILDQLDDYDCQIRRLRDEVGRLLTGRKSKTIEPYYSVQQLADLLGKAYGTVAMWCRSDVVRAFKLPDGAWRIPESAVAELLATDPRVLASASVEAEARLRVEREAAGQPASAPPTSQGEDLPPPTPPSDLESPSSAAPLHKTAAP